MSSFSRKLNFRLCERSWSGNAVISGPVEEPAKGDHLACWYCFFELSEICPIPGKVYGEDSIDAFINALKQIHTLIQKHRELGYEVWWETEGDGGHFIF